MYRTVAMPGTVQAQRTVAQRLPLPDLLRGCAVVLMVIYHFVFDLTLFQFLDRAVMNTAPMHMMQRLCMCSFLFCVGWSLAIAHHDGVNWRAFWRREMRLLAAAVAISGVTYWAMPGKWIFFGILHFIALASVLVLPVLKHALWALLLALLILIPYGLWHWQLPWFDLPHYAADYVPLTPWLGWVLLGVAVRPLPLQEITADLFKKLMWIRWLGRYSLSIYLLHQPLLWALLWLFKKVF